MTTPQATPRRIMSNVVYYGGLSEDIELVEVPQGWRICSIPLGSDVIAFGDYVTLRGGENGTVPSIVGIRAGGYRTVCSWTPIPPNPSIVAEIERRNWRAVWNVEGRISLAVLVDEVATARRAISRWERAGCLVSHTGASTHSEAASA